MKKYIFTTLSYLGILLVIVLTTTGGTNFIMSIDTFKKIQLIVVINYFIGGIVFLLSEKRDIHPLLLIALMVASALLVTLVFLQEKAVLESMIGFGMIGFVVQFIAQMILLVLWKTFNKEVSC